MEFIYDLRQLQTALQNTSVPMVRVYQSIVTVSKSFLCKYKHMNLQVLLYGPVEPFFSLGPHFCMRCFWRRLKEQFWWNWWLGTPSGVHVFYIHCTNMHSDITLLSIENLHMNQEFHFHRTSRMGLLYAKVGYHNDWGQQC